MIKRSVVGVLVPMTPKDKIQFYELSVFRAIGIWLVYKGMVCAKHENLDAAIDLCISKLEA